jgi:hypothetical protein
VRFVEERWVQVGFSCHSEQLPLAGPDGLPLHTLDGSGVKTAEHTILTFTHLDDHGRPVLVVHIPFDQNAKQELLRQMTGVVVPVAAEVNGGVPAA